jgi:hypothetical protein
MSVHSCKKSISHNLEEKTKQEKPDLWLLSKKKNSQITKFSLTQKGIPIYQDKISDKYVSLTDCSQKLQRCPFTGNVFKPTYNSQSKKKSQKLNSWEWCGTYVHDESCPNCKSMFRDCWYYVDYI